MGTVIPVDFRQRRQKHASPDHEVMPGMHGDATAVAICLACLACLHVTLLISWSLWLPSAHPQARRCGHEVKES